MGELIVSIALIVSGVILFLIGIITAFILTVNLFIISDWHVEDLYRAAYLIIASLGILFIGLSL